MPNTTTDCSKGKRSADIFNDSVGAGISVGY
jgi:hypothetical protein